MILRSSVVAISLVALAFTGCSSRAKKEGVKTPEATSVSEKLTRDTILQKYSLAELNSAANALKVVSEQSEDASKTEKGDEILGCAVSGHKAELMSLQLKSLIDSQMHSEIEGYEQDPKAYATSQGFESCASNCSCGVYASVVDGSNVRSMPPGSDVTHKRNVAKLRAKATHQTAEASLACARKQSWICGSDLKKFLSGSGTAGE